MLMHVMLAERKQKEQSRSLLQKNTHRDPLEKIK